MRSSPATPAWVARRAARCAARHRTVPADAVLHHPAVGVGPKLEELPARGTARRPAIGHERAPSRRAVDHQLRDGEPMKSRERTGNPGDDIYPGGAP